MDKLDYINYVIKHLKSIVLEVKGLNITCKITELCNIEFNITKKLTEKELKTIEKEIMKSKFNNWILFQMSGNSKNNYNYRMVNLVLEKDAIMYNREQGLKSLI